MKPRKTIVWITRGGWKDTDFRIWLHKPKREAGFFKGKGKRDTQADIRMPQKQFIRLFGNVRKGRTTGDLVEMEISVQSRKTAGQNEIAK